MASLTQLKQELQFNGRLSGLLDALKAIASQQFQSLERRFRANEAFFDAIQTIAAIFNLERLEHSYTRSSGPVGVIAITSDTGLLGGLNQQVVVAALQEYSQQPGELMVVGERGVAYVRERRLPCKAFASLQDEGRGVLSAQLRDYALERVRAGHLGALSIVYPRALSFTMQRVEMVRALPCTEWLKSPGVTAGPATGPILMESSVARVLDYLVWVWLGYRLFEVLGMSRLAELAARAVHLEGSSQELQRRRNRLMLQYFRQRHEVIDRSMRELFAARSLYGSN